MGDGEQTHPGLKNLFEYPFMDCLVERRTRRVAQGVSINAGALSWQSNNKPSPLSKLEEAVLIVATGVNGLSTHDGPLIKPGGQELASPFLNVVARVASSPDNCQATSYFMINDEGIWLIKTPKKRDALAMVKDLPPRWKDWKEADWIAVADAVKVRVQEKRLDFPREYPYYLGWNAQMSNRPGTTMFFPVVDCTWQYINAIAILLSEPDGKRPVFMDDFRQFHPKGIKEILAWLGMKVGLVPDIPYQPVGGLKWITNKFVNPNNVAPLGFGRALRTDYECFFSFQNLMLVGQALGLGGWIHGSVFPPYIYEHNPAKGWYGLGFRMADAKKLSPWAPIPNSQPNPVGIDGILEGLTPPYVKNMDEAVDRVVDWKYGDKGTYEDNTVFGAPYSDPKYGQQYITDGRHFSPDAIAYTKDICNYIWETYGRFPAHVDAFYSSGMWLQFSHLEMEYYDKYFDPRQYTRQRERSSWGS